MTLGCYVAVSGLVSGFAITSPDNRNTNQRVTMRDKAQKS
jgi:hypothetical protein